MTNFHRAGFHLALAIIPSCVSGFVAFVTTSPITGDLGEKFSQFPSMANPQRQLSMKVTI
jgi:hypothetical protein